MTRIRIVAWRSKEPVGTLEVADDGSIRLLDGPDDLRGFVQRRLEEGLWSVRSFITATGDQIAEPYRMAPDQEDFEHELSIRLALLGYCTASMADLLKA